MGGEAHNRMKLRIALCAFVLAFTSCGARLEDFLPPQRLPKLKPLAGVEELKPFATVDWTSKVVPAPGSPLWAPEGYALWERGFKFGYIKGYMACNKSEGI